VLYYTVVSAYSRANAGDILMSNNNHSFIRFLVIQQLHQSRAMTMPQNRDIMRKPGRKGR